MRSAMTTVVMACLLSGCSAHTASGGAGPAEPTRTVAPRAGGGVSFQLLAAGPEGGAARALPYRAELTSGARFALRIVVEQPAHVYIWHRGGAAGASPELLLPSAGAAATQTLPQAPLMVPAQGQWYTLDRQPGKEVFYVVAAREVLDDARLAALATEIDAEREPPSTTSRDRDGGPAYRVAMDESGLARLAFVLLHR